MKKLLIIIAVSLAACGTRQDNTIQRSGESGSPMRTEAAIPLNDGKRWKADEATRRNVNALLQIASDSTYADATKREELISKLESRVDTMIKECTMQGPAHEALHKWLEIILEDMKALREDDRNYKEAYKTLKKDMESFHIFFE